MAEQLRTLLKWRPQNPAFEQRKVNHYNKKTTKTRSTALSGRSSCKKLTQSI